jgi:hypothetical protein
MTFRVAGELSNVFAAAAPHQQDVHFRRSGAGGERPFWSRGRHVSRWYGRKLPTGRGRARPARGRRTLGNMPLPARPER